MDNAEVALLGASGTAGSAITQALTARGYQVRSIQAPRLQAFPDQVAALHAALDSGLRDPLSNNLKLRRASDSLTESLSGVDAVINAAGVATATAVANPVMFGANSVLPLVVRLAQLQARVKRFIQVSSAAVQGRQPLSPSLSWNPMTPYAESKMWAERILLHTTGMSLTETISIYRATSVHSQTRRVSVQARNVFERLPIVPLGNPPGDSTFCTTEQMGNSIVDMLEDPGEDGSISIEPPHMTTRELVEWVRPGRRTLPFPRWLGEQGFDIMYRLLHGPRAVAHMRRAEVMTLGQRWAE